MEQELIKEIEQIIEGDVDAGDEALTKRSTDYSIFSVRPSLVVFPKHSKDIQNLVRFVHSKKESGGYGNISLTARSAGTCMSGGSLNTSIIIDTTRYMTGVLEVSSFDGGFGTGPSGHSFLISGLARVLPGTYYRDFEKATLAQGMILPCFPASKNLCAVGGMVANNGAGEKTLKYGQNKDFVQELKVVFSDGNEYIVRPLSKEELEVKILEETFEGRLYRSVWNLIQRNRADIASARPKTTKNSSGYLIWDVWDEKRQVFDLTKLIVGAQGTTAIITEITYKLVPVETFNNLLVVFIKDLSILSPMVKDLLRLDVETLEVYDDHTFSFAVKFFRDFLKDKGFVGALRYAFNFIPELFIMIFKGVPKIVLLAQFVSNDPKEIIKEIREAGSIVSKYPVSYRILEQDSQIQKYWDIRRDSFKLLSDHSKKLRTAPFVDDIAVPVECLQDYIQDITALLDEYKLLYTIAGHVGNGNLHIIPLMDFNDPKTKQTILEISPRVFELVKKYNGTMTAEHNDGIVRTPFLPLMFSETIIEVFQEIKTIFDKHTIFNPNKKVGGTIKMFQDSIIQTKLKG